MAVQSLLVTLMVLMALAIATAPGLFSAVVYAAILSMLSVVLFTSLHAVDVALTEAAVGAGVSLVLFVSCLAVVGGGETAPVRRPRHLVALLMAIPLAALLCYGTLDMDAVGAAQSPVHTHLAPGYVRDTHELLGIPNMVTGILASFRGYDTLGELIVIFTAGVGVLALLGRGVTGNGN